MRVDFCLPIKNEAGIIEENILNLISYLDMANFEFSWRIIGALNGSTDNSAEILEKLKQKFSGKLDFFSVKESGKGLAIKTCWRKSEAEILFFIDADLPVSLDCVEKILEPLLEHKADLVIGSRFAEGAVVERTKWRKAVSKVYVTISKCLLPHNQLDLQCGFKAISNEGFKKIERLLINNDYFFDTELVILSESFGLRILEAPVNWRENRKQDDKSHVNIFKDAARFIKNLICFRFYLKKIKKYPYSE